MKIAVIKLGGRITWNTDGAVAPGEAVSICKALSRGGAEVHVFTRIIAKDVLHPSLNWHNIGEIDAADLEGLDTLVVINGNVNFFGGAEDREQILNYSIINNFQGKVVYVMCDPELPLAQIWGNVSKKEWGAKYHERDVNIVRKDIRVLSQPFNLAAVKARWPKNAVQVAEFFHFPMERFPLLNEWLKPMEEPVIDLLYGGTPRGGRRIPNLYKWYWGIPKDISTEIFGSIDADDFLKHPKLQETFKKVKTDGERYESLDWFSPPTFTGKVKYDQVLAKMNTGLAHLVTGDGSYENLDIIPQRTMENIAAGNVVFIDANMDKARRIYPKGTLAHEFLYVATQAELVEKLRYVKSDWTLRHELLESGASAQNFVPDEFCKSLVKVLS